MITSGASWNGNETLSIVVRPAFIGLLPKGMKPIFTENAKNVKKSFWAHGGNALVKYSSGFTGGEDSTKKQKVFELGEWKSENSWDKHTYADLVQSMTADVKGAFQNDIFKSEFKNTIPFGLLGIDPSVPPTEEQLVYMAEYLIQSMGIAQGIFEAFYLSDTNKIVEKGEGTGTFPNGSTKALYAEDIRFTPVDGLWKNIFTKASLTPVAADDEIQRVEIAASTPAVAQVETVTVTGTSGTAVVDCKGVSKTATWDTDLATTATNFATNSTNVAAYLAAGLILADGAGATFTLTAVVPGVEFDAPTITNATGDLAGTVAHTTANVNGTGLAANKARDTMRSMVTKQALYLKGIPNSKKVFLMTDSMIENYQETLGAAGSGMTTSESARGVMVDGTGTLKFNGIPIERMPIEAAIEAYDFGYPNRVILTIPENIAPVLSSANGFAESMLWFNKDENENRTRTQLEFGGDYWLPELMVVAY